MTDQDKNKADLAVTLKTAKETFSPVLHKELYTQLAKEYKITYDCYRREGFTMVEALRLTLRCFE